MRRIQPGACPTSRRPPGLVALHFSHITQPFVGPAAGPGAVPRNGRGPRHAGMRPPRGPRPTARRAAGPAQLGDRLRQAATLAISVTVTSGASADGRDASGRWSASRTFPPRSACCRDSGGIDDLQRNACVGTDWPSHADGIGTRSPACAERRGVGQIPRRGPWRHVPRLGDMPGLGATCPGSEQCARCSGTAGGLVYTSISIRKIGIYRGEAFVPVLIVNGDLCRAQPRRARQPQGRGIGQR